MRLPNFMQSSDISWMQCAKRVNSSQGQVMISEGEFEQESSAAMQLTCRHLALAKTRAFDLQQRSVASGLKAGDV